MATRSVQPDRFTVEAAVVDWIDIYRARAEEELQLAGLATGSQGDVRSRFSIATPSAIPPRSAHLRWNTAPEVGIGSAPFRVWRRPHIPFVGEEVIPIESLFGMTGPNNVKVISWNRPLAQVRLRLNVAGAGALIIGYAGSPIFERWVSFVTTGSGLRDVVLTGTAMTGAILPPNATLEAIAGLEADTAANDPSWELVEIVGLPVEPGQWAGIGTHGEDQGIVTSLGSPIDAALARFERGKPVVGWAAEMAAGVPAPTYELPDPLGLVEEMTEQILGMIRGLMPLPPDQMAAQLTSIQMPPPENSGGSTAPTEPSKAQFSPLVLLLSGVATDPLLSLILGFGTAIPQQNLPTVTFADRQFFETEDDFDYMVTVDWENGFDDDGDEVTLAALALRPQPAFAGATPTGMQGLGSMPMMPLAADGDWRRSTRVSWDRVPKTGLYRVASYVAAGASMAPPEPSELFNERRDSGGPRPIAANLAADDDPDPTRLSVVDQNVAIPAPALPVQNGFVTKKYAVVTQTIFGLWGKWTDTDIVLFEPPPDRVRVLGASLRATAVPAGPCPAELVIDFGWDWSVRRPEDIIVGGRLYAAAKRSDPPPSEVPSLQLPRSLGAADPALVISFSGDVPSAPGVTIEGLTEDGDAFAPFGPAQGDEVRRYRATIPGFSLDFDATPHVGLALFCRVIERRPPQRIGPWPERPYLIAESDPRPPPIVIDYVQIGSLPDADGRSHGRLEWPTAAVAVGYIVYEASETKLREELGLAPAAQGETLSARLMAVRPAFSANPVRNAFSRRLPELLQGNSTDVTLPRGSTDIHFFVVLAQTAGGVMSEWPSGPDAGDRLIPIAAPRVATPAPPMLEVRRVVDDTVDPPVARAAIQVTPRIGHRTKRVVLHRTRVADAARAADSMGPPIADISSSTATWTVDTASDAVATDFIVGVDGTDTPSGSWERVWYRALAWSEDDLQRALLRGRSEPSPAQHVVVPPPGPPDLGMISVQSSGGALAEALLSWTSEAPVEPTALGPHRMSIDVRIAGAPGLAPPLLSDEQALDELPAFGPAAVTGWWRHGPPAPDGTQEYRALLVRPTVDTALSVAVRLRDPIGRVSESLFTVLAGPVDPDPVIDSLQLLRLAPGLLGASWNSDVPLTATAAGPYRFTITATLARDGGGPGGIIVNPNLPPRPRPIIATPSRDPNPARRPGPTVLNPNLPGRRPSMITSRRTRRPFIRPRPTSPTFAAARGLRPAGPIGPVGPGGLTTRPKSLRLIVDIPDIDALRRPPLIAPSDSLVIWRQRSFGRGVTFGVATGARVTHFRVRLNAPDGRFAEANVEVR